MLGDNVDIHLPEHGWYSISDAGLFPLLSRFMGFSVDVRPLASRNSVDGSPGAETRYDMAPIHLVTSASTDNLRRLHPTGNPDIRRFRANIFIECFDAQPSFLEQEWGGSSLQIVKVTALVTEPTKRCGFTIIPQLGLASDPDILRNIMRHGGKNLGVYCRPETLGILGVGELVTLPSCSTANVN
jgi:uncharacterized protein YcbX